MSKRKSQKRVNQLEQTPFQRFQDLARRLFAVPKTEIDKQEEIYKQQSQQKNKKPN